MPRRNKKKDDQGGNSKHPPKKPAKVATPENPAPQEPSAIHVNPMYDQMPDKIEDPGAVFKLAYLDMKQVAANNKLAFVAQEYALKIQALERERNNEINNLKAEMQRIKDARRVAKEEIEKQYNIALRSYSYDDVTGVLTKQALEDIEKKKSKSENQESQKEETLH